MISLAPKRNVNKFKDKTEIRKTVGKSIVNRENIDFITFNHAYTFYDYTSTDT